MERKQQSRSSGGLKADPLTSIIEDAEKNIECDIIGVGLRDISSLRLDRRCEVLNLHGNLLSSIRGLPALSSLRELNLSSNEFVSCDLPELAFLQGLQVLDLSGNAISSLLELPFIPGLHTLAISFNNIRSLAGLGENVPDCENLDVRGNLLASEMDLNDLHSLESLTRLEIGGRSPNPVCNVNDDNNDDNDNSHNHDSPVSTVTFAAVVASLFASCDNLDKVDEKGRAAWESKGLREKERERERRRHTDTVSHGTQVGSPLQGHRGEDREEREGKREESFEQGESGNGNVPPSRETKTTKTSKSITNSSITPKFDILSRRYRGGSVTSSEPAEENTNTAAELDDSGSASASSAFPPHHLHPTTMSRQRQKAHHPRVEEDAHHLEGDKDKHYRHATHTDTQEQEIEQDQELGIIEQELEQGQKQEQGGHKGHKGELGGRCIDVRMSVDAYCKTPSVLEVPVPSHESHSGNSPNSGNSNSNPWGDESISRPGNNNNTSAFDVDHSYNSYAHSLSDDFSDSVDETATNATAPATTGVNVGSPVSPGSIRARIVTHNAQTNNHTDPDGALSPVSPTVMAQRLAPPTRTSVDSLPRRKITNNTNNMTTASSSSGGAGGVEPEAAELATAAAGSESNASTSPQRQNGERGGNKENEKDKENVKENEKEEEGQYKDQQKENEKEEEDGELLRQTQTDVADLRQQLLQAQLELKTQATEHLTSHERSEKRYQQEKLETGMALKKCFRHEADLMASKKELLKEREGREGAVRELESTRLQKEVWGMEQAERNQRVRDEYAGERTEYERRISELQKETVSVRAGNDQLVIKGEKQELEMQALTQALQVLKEQLLQVREGGQREEALMQQLEGTKQELSESRKGGECLVEQMQDAQKGVVQAKTESDAVLARKEEEWNDLLKGHIDMLALERERAQALQVSISLRLSLRLKGIFLCTDSVLCHLKWCIR